MLKMRNMNVFVIQWLFRLEDELHRYMFLLYIFLCFKKKKL
jgi:hypothetical protein